MAHSRENGSELPSGYLSGSRTVSANQTDHHCKPTELVLNGSFEEPYLGHGRWQPLPQIEGWRLAFGPAIELQNHVAGSPQDGEQFVELDSHGSSGITQQIPTVAGQNYKVGFWFSPRPGRSTSDNKMAVFWDGQAVARIQANGSTLSTTEWTYYEYELTASSDVTRLEFHHVGNSNSYGAYVDAVSVTHTEECALQTASGFTLYDDFEMKRVDTGKWFGQQSASGGPGGLELVRRIDRNGHLVMMHRVSGGHDSSIGRHISRNRLRMPSDKRIAGMQYDVMVKRLKLRGCEAEGASGSVARARGSMFLFNDGSSTSSSSAMGDVGAVVEVRKSVDSDLEKGTYHLRGFVFRCRTGSCSSTSTIGSVDLGTVKRREVVTLGMQWHDETNEVSFWKNDEDRQVVAYDVSDDDPSVFSNQRLEVRVEGANCEVGDRPFAEMRALFDNVYVKK